MFRHRGKARAFKHNFRLAAFLSFVAGIVNISGVLSLGVLTTNVTGHFAYFAEGAVKEDISSGIHFLEYILAFLAGSFFSNLLTEYFAIHNRKAPNNTAMFIEIFLLLGVGLFGDPLIALGFSKPVLACVLLFTMGLQNSLVTRISDATIRTTHLTGLFTDLGIELAQLFFYKEKQQQKKLLSSIGLRGGIIIFFFSGCVIGGLLYIRMQFRVLIIATLVLITAVIYDNLRLGFYKIRKRLKESS